MKFIDAHDEDFFEPLVGEVLAACPNYRAQSSFVIEIIGEYMKERFTEADKARLPKDPTIRWKKRVHFTRLQMVEKGLIEANAGFGIWQLTQKGIERFALKQENQEVNRGTLPFPCLA